MDHLRAGGRQRRPAPELPAFCRTRRAASVIVTASSLAALRLLVLLGLLFQLSTLLLVLVRPVPPPLTGTNTDFRPVAGIEAGAAAPIPPRSQR